LKNLNISRKDISDTTLDGDNQLPVFVAIIDDEVDLACLFKEALSQIDGVQVFAFTDPLLALEHFQTNHRNYSVVISDYRMPTMTGMELLSTVKDVNPAVTRIMMSAFEIQDELFQEFKCVDKFLQKPVLMTDLINEVRMLVSKMQIADTNRIS
jgi:DNA-binding NtrC family response regulator